MVAIRRLLAKGTPEALTKANSLAKGMGGGKKMTPFKPVAQREIHEGGRLVARERSAGHQIRQIGSGPDQAATLIADPALGISVRKTRHHKSKITTESAAHRGAVYAELKKMKSRAAPDFHGSFIIGPAGRTAEFHGFAMGKPVEDVLKTVSRGEQEKILTAVNLAKRDVREAGRRAGRQIFDMGSKGNIRVHKAKGGWGAQVVDFNTRPAAGTAVSPPSPRDVARRVVNPSADEFAAYERRRPSARAVKSKELAGLGDFMAKAKPAKRSVDAAAQARAADIEAFLAKKRVG